MRFQIAIACAVALLGCATSSSAQAVSLQFNNGRVTLSAQSAPIRTILTEWGRLGGTRMVNHERINGAPVTLELTDVPERQALDILLRSAAGYIVTERQGSGVSTLGGVVILATSNAPRAQAPVTFGAATVQPTPRSLFEETREPEERPGVNVTPVIQQPAIVRFPAQSPTPSFQLEPAPAPNQPRPVTTLQTLPGTSRPGEISPVPQQAPAAPGLPPPPPQR